MTPQIKLAAIGGTAALVTRFYFQKPWQTSLLIGLAAISAIAVLTAHTDTPVT